MAVGELVMYGREYAVVIRPGCRGLVLHTLFFAHEVIFDVLAAEKLAGSR